MGLFVPRFYYNFCTFECGLKLALPILWVALVFIALLLVVALPQRGSTINRQNESMQIKLHV